MDVIENLNENDEDKYKIMLMIEWEKEFISGFKLESMKREKVSFVRYLW